MLVTAILCALIGLSAAQTWPLGTCGKRPLVSADSDKIVGGTQAVPGDWPWSCSMLSSGRHICGGSLINDKWIVTAAHCVSNGVAVSTYTWDCGVHDRTNQETWVRRFATRRYIVHPNYNSRLIQNDIAIFELTASIAPYTNYFIPACFPTLGTNYEGATSWATGWGTLFSGGAVSRYHMQVAMPVLTDAACRSKFGGTNNMLDPATQVCAGISGANKDTCQGDSGGPLVVKQSDGYWYLIGLTSWGYGCGDGGVYTRTSAYRSWVESYTGTLSGPIGN